MNKAISALLILVWLPMTTYAGYRLAEKSFGWIDEPYFGLAPSKGAEGRKPLDMKALSEKLPKPGADPVEWLKGLSPAALDCIKKAVGPEIYAAALRGDYGDLPKDQAVKAFTCL